MDVQLIHIGDENGRLKSRPFFVSVPLEAGVGWKYPFVARDKAGLGMKNIIDIC